jgi:hypothetical protein
MSPVSGSIAAAALKAPLESIWMPVSNKKNPNLEK